MLSISPSLLGSYEYWRSIEDADKSKAKLEELVASIRGERTPSSEAMLLGRAFHEAVGLNVIGTDKIDVEADGKVFSFDCESLAGFRELLPKESLFEVPGRLELPEIDVVMSLRVDAISGLTVDEIKVSTWAPKPDYHEHSAQWRCYLLAFEAEHARYLVAQLGSRKGRHYVKDHAVFSHYAYDGMREDVASRVAKCKQFIIKQGLAAFREVR